jgi:mRNA-degrading endonuclease toxin of MazEF toxin-antitoxin module
VTTTGEPLPGRGEIWWVRVDKRRPAIVVQSNAVREPRVRSFLVVPLTSRLHLADLPGNLQLSRQATGLSKTSVANVYDVQTALRADFLERAGTLPAESLASLEAGLRLVLHL